MGRIDWIDEIMVSCCSNDDDQGERKKGAKRKATTTFGRAGHVTAGVDVQPRMKVTQETKAPRDYQTIGMQGIC